MFRREGLTGLRKSWKRAIPRAKLAIVLEDGTIVDCNDYTGWLARYAGIDTSKRARIASRIAQMERRPTISIVMPVYNANIGWLREAIESVRAQLYENWELCIADDCSTEPLVKQTLQEYAGIDDRIRVVYRDKNGHISQASNSAIELVAGAWIALLDQDDLLTEDALYYVAEAIAANPRAGLIYSDEDKIDEQGNRFSPHFKSDWNPELFLSYNIISHLGVYSAALVRQVGGFRRGYEGSQDHDLALRIVEGIEPSQIVHIPRVLYNWRAHSGSTAASGDNKSYAAIAGQRAIRDHLKRKGVDGDVELSPFGPYRVRYNLPKELPLVSLIIPTRNDLKLVRTCVESILSTTAYPRYEIIVVDNKSDDPGTRDYLEKMGKTASVRIIRDEGPFNHSAINNRAVAAARGSIIGLISNDIKATSADWLEDMVSMVLQTGIGAVGARLWSANNRLQHGGIILGIGGLANHSHLGLRNGRPGYMGRVQIRQSLSAVTGACLIVRKSVFDEVGGLDEGVEAAFSDIDFCMRVREAGYRNVWTPFSDLYRQGSRLAGLKGRPDKTAGRHEQMVLMRERWGKFLMADPAYSPNLTLERTDFSLSWPPRVQEPWE
ncbi:glycosyltransferase family 2 protein [Mesorhizobium loti]|uniref:glycosyltransferase family 2 protein n=1 Tax=Rhizobium loti TaxID=381 RepID=UPI001ABF7B55|nr:glycosyltransferase family 2 protein [Mesorhizobium loti]